MLQNRTRQIDHMRNSNYKGTARKTAEEASVSANVKTVRHILQNN